VPAFHGRLLEVADQSADEASTVVLSHGYWQRRFGGDRSVVGHLMTLNDHAFTVVGIAPPSFRGLVTAREVDFWIPLSAEPRLRTPSWTSDAGYKWLQLVGRVRRGSTVEAARAEYAALFRVAVIEPDLAVVKDPTARERYKRFRPVVGLARATTQRHEVAVRLSLGARCGRAIRQFLTESQLLAVGGAAAGVLVAYAACRSLATLLATTRTPILLDVEPDLRALAFSASLALATGLLCGFAPAWRATAVVAPAMALHASHRLTGGRDRRFLPRGLVAAQVALSVMMLFSGGLFLRSLYNVRSIDKGFDSSSVLLVNADSSRGKPEPDLRTQQARRWLVDGRAVPIPQ
jgi:macrolide transport system ATP-binding/permease protein